MSFDRNDYLSWYVPRIMRHDDAVNLHSSGVPSIDPDSLDVPGGDPWAHVPRFEETLSAWLGLTPEEVVFTPGATGGTLLALLTLARQGSELLVEAPMYEPMVRQAERLGRVGRLERRGPGFELPLEEARERITEETAVVMITEPHNPSGRYAPREQVLELVELSRAQGATVLVNEVYLGYGDRPSYHGVADNVVVVSSLSKLMGAYWARLGWLSARGDTADRLRGAHANMSMGTKPAAAAGVAILATASERRREAADLAAAKLRAVDEWVASTPGLSWLPPEGPGFGLVALPDGADDVALAERLHDERGVLTVPGSMFGCPGALRIAWLQAGDRLEVGLAVVAEELART